MADTDSIDDTGSFVVDDEEYNDISQGGSFNDEEPPSPEPLELDAPVRLQSERTHERRIRFVGLCLIGASLLGVIAFIGYNVEDIAPVFSDMRGKLSKHSSTNTDEQNLVDNMVDSNPDFSQSDVDHMKQRLLPKELLPVTGDPNTFESKQFVHLHHMKTGGTSLDTLIRCGTSRLKKMGYSIPYSSLHECSPRMYSRCVDGSDEACLSRMSDATVISFCGPLRDLPVFSWTPSLQEGGVELPDYNLPDHPVNAVTVLRHPVERVWSMYRFRTKACYGCKNLTEVYDIIDRGRAEEEFGSGYEICTSQLENHMTRNLIQHKMVGLEGDVVDQAVDDISKFFTIIGLTEDMNATRRMVGTVFPWLAETIEGSDQTCSLPHANKSPQNNRCGPGGTHWDLPPHPSEEEAELIRQHNQLDLKVYHAGERQHHLQKIALGLEDN